MQSWQRKWRQIVQGDICRALRCSFAANFLHRVIRVNRESRDVAIISVKPIDLRSPELKRHSCSNRSALLSIGCSLISDDVISHLPGIRQCLACTARLGRPIYTGCCLRLGLYAAGDARSVSRGT